MEQKIIKCSYRNHGDYGDYIRGDGMINVNIREAKADLSKLIRLIESKREDEIMVSKNGKPVAKIVPVQDTPVSNRIGIAKGKILVPKDFDRGNEEIMRLMTGGDL